MHIPFKDGPFVMALENGVPIVPITFKNLNEIMPASTIHFGRPHVIFHQAIETKGLSKADIPMLKKMVYDTIQGELDKYYNLSPTPYEES
jgi:1-acyl-sn-glycerol-3-phosphate acyltransferase